MRLVNLYLLGYVAFVIGVLLTLWRSGVLSYISPVWVAVGLVIAAFLGVMFAVTASRPLTMHERK